MQNLENIFPNKRGRQNDTVLHLDSEVNRILKESFFNLKNNSNDIYRNYDLITANTNFYHLKEFFVLFNRRTMRLNIAKNYN